MRLKKKRKEIESDISQLTDLFKLPKYQKTVFPLVNKRKTSTNLFDDNQE